jgi:hypothetical protein
MRGYQGYPMIHLPNKSQSRRANLVFIVLFVIIKPLRSLLLASVFKKRINEGSKWLNIVDSYSELIDIRGLVLTRIYLLANWI